MNKVSFQKVILNGCTAAFLLSGLVVSGYSFAAEEGGLTDIDGVMDMMKSAVKDDEYEILDIEKIVEEGFGTSVESIAKDKAYDEIKDQASGLLKDATGQVEDIPENIKKKFEINTDQVSQQVTQTVQQKIKDMATGQVLLDMVNPEANITLNLESLITPPTTGIIPVPTIDTINLIVGVYDVEQVFKNSQENDEVRDHNTRACSVYGISDLSSAKSTGEYCCEKWSKFGANGLAMTTVAGGSLTVVLDFLQKQIQKEMCCKLSPGMCESKPEEKAACVNGNLANGTGLDASMKVCEVECGSKDYGSLSYNEDGKYDENQIAELVKECYKEADKWSPSPTVLTASEMAPIVPPSIKDLISGGEGEQK